MSKKTIILGVAAVVAIAAVATWMGSSDAPHKAAAPAAQEEPGAGPAGSRSQPPPGSPAPPGTPGATASSQAAAFTPADDPALASLGPGAQKAYILAMALRDVDSPFGSPSSIMEQIVALGPDAVEGLAAFLRQAAPAGDESLRKRDYNARIGVMNMLGEIGSESGLPVLAEILRDSEQPSSLNTAARNIGRIGGHQAFDILNQTAADASQNAGETEETREKASILGMGLCGDPRAVPVLAEYLKDEKKPEQTRVYAAGCLGMLGDGSGLSLATRALASDDYNVAIVAARSLGVIGDPSSIDVLKAREESANNLLLQETIKVSLFQLEAAQKPGDEKAAYIKDQLLLHPLNSPFVQWGTLELRRMGTPAAAKVLEDMAAMTGKKYEMLSWAAKIRSQS